MQPVISAHPEPVRPGVSLVTDGGASWVKPHPALWVCLRSYLPNDSPVYRSSIGYAIDSAFEVIYVQDSSILGQKCFLVQSPLTGARIETRIRGDPLHWLGVRPLTGARLGLQN